MNPVWAGEISRQGSIQVVLGLLLSALTQSVVKCQSVGRKRAVPRELQDQTMCAWVGVPTGQR